MPPVFLAIALRQLPLGTAYAIWTGMGIIGTTVLGALKRGSCLIWSFSCKCSFDLRQKLFCYRREGLVSFPDQIEIGFKLRSKRSENQSACR